MSKEFALGDLVRVIALPAYLKTAESMPMLRPPNAVGLGEEGTILDHKPGGYWSVRFKKGAFLMESHYIEAVQDTRKNSEEGTAENE